MITSLSYLWLSTIRVALRISNWGTVKLIKFHGVRKTTHGEGTKALAIARAGLTILLSNYLVNYQIFSILIWGFLRFFSNK